MRWPDSADTAGVRFPGRIGRAAALLLFTLLCAGTVGTARASDDAWVSGKVSLNLRSGPGTQYKILGKVSAEDHVTIVQTRDGWRQVQTDRGREGWIPAGYLVDTPPASVRLERAEAELADARAALDTSREEAGRRIARLESDSKALRRSNEEIAARDADQKTRITRLQEANRELQTALRWREWLVGAGILVVGMITGALLRGSGRKRGSRVRL